MTSSGQMEMRKFETEIDQCCYIFYPKLCTITTTVELCCDEQDEALVADTNSATGPLSLWSLQVSDRQMPATIFIEKNKKNQAESELILEDVFDEYT